VPGEGGFFGGAGRGLGTNILLSARRPLRNLGFGSGVLETRTFAVVFRPEGLFDVAFAEELLILFFFRASFLTGRLLSLDELAGLLLLADASFFAGAVFFPLGEAVIRPGRFGFLDGDFLALVARIF
jgi:hypothetical protein